MNVLILGSGGREHALAWKIAKSSSCNKLYIAPGNAGTQELGVNIAVDVNNFESIRNVVISKQINMVVVGPEDPLVNGIFDYFQNDDELRSISIIGPSKEGAKLEGSKMYAKQFMQKYNIPTAKYQSFEPKDLEKGYNFLESLNPPYVLKADGLAAGKGVLILDNLNEAKQELKSMLVDKKFGAASNTVVVEEFLEGIELSVFVLTDGETYKILPTAKDYKRIGEGDTGLNTGGMGAISPVPFADRFYLEKIEREIIKPTMNGIRQENITYKGFIFFGLIDVNGQPKVIEYNVRMGDPETEVVIPRITSDLLNLFKGIDDGTFSEKDLHVSKQKAATVMLVSKGYPESYSKGFEITCKKDIKNSMLFHAGTTLKDNRIITNGGRVLAVTSLSETIQNAVESSYENIKNIDFTGKKYRKDIGFDL